MNLSNLPILYRLLRYPFYFFTDIIFPQYCNECGILLDSSEENFFCAECSDKKLKIIKPENICNVCGKKLYIDYAVDTDLILCKDCRKHKPYFEKSIHLFEYSGNIKFLIKEYKYRGVKPYSEIFIRLFSEIIEEKMIFKNITFDYLINVPESAESIEKRGFDHIDLICSEISRKTQIEYLKNFVYKKRNNIRQAGLDRKQRIENVKKLFDVTEKNIDLNNKNVLIIDDVFSTGSTINEMSKILKKKFKNSYVYALTFARGI